jgi:hypothetical protein
MGQACRAGCPVAGLAAAAGRGLAAQNGPQQHPARMKLPAAGGAARQRAEAGTYEGRQAVRVAPHRLQVPDSDVITQPFGHA